MKKIKTFEDACKKLKITTELPDLIKLPTKQKKILLANYKLSIIAEALNKGWYPNWKDRNEWKYRPYFYYTPGVGFLFDGCAYDFAHAAFGSRLCFKTEELAKYAGKQFLEIYKDLLM